MPTIDMLYNRVTTQMEDFPYKRTSFYELMKKLQFKHKKLNKRAAIIEQPRLVKWRYSYLRQIAKFREEGCKVFYLDETWYDSHNTPNKGWTDGTHNCQLDLPVGRGKRIIIAHCGNEDGFVVNGLLLSAKDIKSSSADYHEDMTANLFERWFSGLLSKLPNGSVIVLDNAPYHSRQFLKVPNMSTKKSDILDFMRQHNIPFEEDKPPRKDILVQQIRRCNIKPTYVIDEMAKERGMTVLRLPPYHCCFNPIEMVWSQVKRFITRYNRQPKMSESVILLIREAMEQVTAENWSSYVAHVKKTEKEYANMDTLVDKAFELIINVDDSSDASDD